MCYRPLLMTGAEVGCGKCESCLINRARLWTGRIMLEASQHVANSFVTLTYDVDHLPQGGSLVPRDLQLFLKRLRHLCVGVRFFAVGEYGDKSLRPHYHLALFGVFPYDHVSPVVQRVNKSRCVCVVCRCWTLGVVDIGNLEMASASYIVGYLLKGFTKKGDSRLDGKYPEFRRMSLRPYGVGASVALGVVEFVGSRNGAKFVQRTGDVPGEFVISGKKFTFGRYLKSVIRRGAGFYRWHSSPAVVQAFRSLHMVCMNVDVQYKDAIDQKRKQTEYRVKRMSDQRRLKRRI